MRNRSGLNRRDVLHSQARGAWSCEPIFWSDLPASRIVAGTFLSLSALVGGCREPDPVGPSFQESQPSSLARFAESACPIEFPPHLNVDCGVLTVPEDRVKDNGRTIRLPVAIVRTQSTAPAPDPIVYVTGGPASNEIHPFNAEFFSSLPVAADRDFILYNQRGVGFAEPRLGCPEFDNLAAVVFPGIPTLSQGIDAVARCFTGW